MIYRLSIKESSRDIDCEVADLAVTHEDANLRKILHAAQALYERTRLTRLTFDLISGTDHRFRFTTADGRTWLQRIFLIDSDPLMTLETTDQWRLGEFVRLREVRNELLAAAFEIGLTKYDLRWS